MTDDIQRAREALTKVSHAFAFEGGSLCVRIEGHGDRDGSGYLAFRDSELDFDEEGYRSVEIANSEWIAIRDKLNELFPPALAALAQPAPVDVPSGAWTAEIQHGPEGEQDYAWVKAPDGELICIAKTHNAQLIAAALAATPPADAAPSGVEVIDRESLEKAVNDAMVEAWNDYTGDTGCFPDDFKITRGPKLHFDPRSFARLTAVYLHAALATPARDDGEAS